MQPQLQYELISTGKNYDDCCKQLDQLQSHHLHHLKMSPTAINNLIYSTFFPFHPTLFHVAHIPIQTLTASTAPKPS